MTKSIRLWGLEKDTGLVMKDVDVMTKSIREEIESCLWDDKINCEVQDKLLKLFRSWALNKVGKNHIGNLKPNDYDFGFKEGYDEAKQEIRKRINNDKE